ncbi:MAG: ABC transporter substrate-binding protein [Terracoccus sp.]
MFLDLASSPVLLDPLDALVAGPDRNCLRVGLAIPASGVLGLTGPAALAAAILAVEEINARGGVGGRRVELIPIDAGAATEAVADEVRSLLMSQSLEVLFGFHTSDIHRRLEHLTAGRVPYFFTPPHEGGNRVEGVILVGDGPADQLVPIAQQLAGPTRRRRWALIGNDYIWPRAVHSAATEILRDHGADVVHVELVAFGRVNSDRIIDDLRRLRADAVLLSLVGRDLATFNRAFAGSPLSGRVSRVSGALEETGLLEIEGDDTGELYSSMPWFAADPESEGLRERYGYRWGTQAPHLGVYAAGCYDGLHLMAEVGNARQLHVETVAAASAALLTRRRGASVARAEGLDLVRVG